MKLKPILRPRLATAALTIVCGTMGARAADNYWTLNGNGLWESQTNWLLGLPQASHRVFIGYAPHAFLGITTTHQSGTTAIQSLFSKNAFRLFGGSLSLDSLSETSLLEHNYTQNAGLLTGAGALDVTGSTNWSGGTMSGAGTFRALGSLSLTGSLSILGGRSVQGLASSVWGGAAIISAAGSSLVNGGTMTVTGSAQLSGGSFVSNGTTTVGPSASLRLTDVSLSGTGTLRIDGPAHLRLFGENSLSGTVAVTTNNLDTAAGIGGTGSLAIQAAGFVRGFGYFGQTTADGVLTSLSNAGTISSDVAGKTLSVRGNSFTNTGVIEAKNGAIAELSFGSFASNGGTIRADGANSKVIFASPVSSSGAVNMHALNGGRIQLDSDITNTGTINLGTGAEGSGFFDLNGRTLFGGSYSNSRLVVGNGTLDHVTFDSLLTIPTNRLYTIRGTDNLASISLDGQSRIRLEGANTLNSELMLTTTNLDSTYGVGGVAQLTVGSGGKVRGTGFFGQTTADGTLSTLSNSGIISSDVVGKTLSLRATAATNAGTIEAKNGATAELLFGTFTSNGGTFRADGANSHLLLDSPLSMSGSNSMLATNGGRIRLGSDITNTGTINLGTGAEGSGFFDLNGRTLFGGSYTNSRLVVGNGTLDHVTFDSLLTIPTNRLYTIRGTDNLASISLDGDSRIRLEGANTLNSTLNQSTANFSSTFGVGGAVSMTVSPTGVARGFGFFGQTTADGRFTTLNNTGLVSADVAGKTLDVRAQTFSNSGVMEARNTGRLIVQADNFTNVGNIKTIGANNELTVAALTGVQNQGTMEVTTGSALFGSSQLVNTGSIVVGAGSAMTMLDDFIQTAGTTTMAGFMTTQAGLYIDGGQFLTQGILNVLGKFRYNTTGSISLLGTYNNTSTFDVNMGKVLITQSGSHTGKFNSAGTGEYVFKGGTHNFGSGAIIGGNATVNGAVLNMNAGSQYTGTFNVVFGSVVFHPGSVNAASAIKVGLEGSAVVASAMGLQGELDNSGSFAIEPGTAVTTSDAVNNSGSMNLAGSLTVVSDGFRPFGSGDISNSGSMSLNSGTMSAPNISNSGSMSITGTSSATGSISNSGSMSVTGGTFSVNGSISNSGTFSLSNSSSMFVFGGYSQSGGSTSVGNGSTMEVLDPVNIDAGLLTGSGTIVADLNIADATVAPGETVGEMVLNGSLSLSNSSTFLADIAGRSNSGTFDKLSVLGGGTVDGTLRASLKPGIALNNGDVYRVLTFTDSYTGTFDTLQINSPQTNYWSIVYGSDYVGLKFSKGGYQSGSTGQGVVPEPGSLLAVSLGLAGLGWRRSRRG